MEHVERLGLAVLAGPIDAGVLHAVLGEELRRAARGEELVALALQLTGCLKHVHLLLRGTGGQQDVLLRDAVAHGEHGLEHGTRGVVADAAHLARRGHVDAQHGVGLLQTVEGELRGLDTHVVQVEEVLVRLLYGDAQHDLRGQLDEVELQHLADEGERTRGTEITLDDLDVVVARQELDVERAGDVQLLGYLAADALDAAHGLHVELLRRELDGGVARVHAGKLDVLGDGVGDDFAVLCHGIHLHLLGVLDELAHHHGVFLRYVGRQLEEALQLFLVGADVHGGAAQHVAGTDEHGETYLLDESVDVFHRRQRAPLGLVHADAVEHGGELVAVFGIVDALGRGAEDADLLRVETQGQVVRYLTAGRDDDAVRVLQVEDVHDALEGELVEVEAVAHVVVGGDGLGIIVNHHTAVALLADGVQGLHAAPVELYAGADAVGT